MQEMGEKGGDVMESKKWGRKVETSWKEIVVPNFLKFFPTGLTQFYVMRPARVK